MVAPVKRHRGSRDTHGTHTGHTGAHGHTDHTDEPHNHPNPTTLTRTTTRRPKPYRNRGRLNSRRPGADRSPRPTQKRPPPANPTLPPPAPRAPPRPAPARKRSANGRNEGARGRCVSTAGGAARAPDELETREAEAGMRNGRGEADLRAQRRDHEGPRARRAWSGRQASATVH